ncbi:MAG: DnaJ domain-containing protein [Isosphaeraceae bacterium]|nr:DnaJ domain-containing protein [Isosphaeraceae bacterium]
MSNPFDVLGVPADAGEVEIRQRYLALVREFPPDRAPERFAAVRAAYEEVRDPARRLETQLFSPGKEDSLEAIMAELRARLAAARPTVDTLLALADIP